MHRLATRARSYNIQRVHRRRRVLHGGNTVRVVAGDALGNVLFSGRGEFAVNTGLQILPLFERKGRSRMSSSSLRPNGIGHIVDISSPWGTPMNPAVVSMALSISSAAGLPPWQPEQVTPLAKWMSCLNRAEALSPTSS